MSQAIDIEPLDEARHYFQQAMKILNEEVERVKKQNQQLKKQNGKLVNKTKAASYLGYTPSYLSRLIRKYKATDLLEFDELGYISITELDRFESHHKKQRWSRS